MLKVVLRHGELDGGDVFSSSWEVRMSIVDDLAKLQELRQKGALTEQEYDLAKQRLLGLHQTAESTANSPVADVELQRPSTPTDSQAHANAGWYAETWGDAPQERFWNSRNWTYRVRPRGSATEGFAWPPVPPPPPPCATDVLPDRAASKSKPASLPIRAGSPPSGLSSGAKWAIAIAALVIIGVALGQGADDEAGDTGYERYADEPCGSYDRTGERQALEDCAEMILEAEP